MADVKAPYFPFYAADYLSDENVMLMSLAGEGAYIRLLCFSWREGSIPNDIKLLARLCRIDSLAMTELWAELEPCFKQHPDDPTRLVHPRLEKERERFCSYHKERSEAGKRGAKSRWNKGMDASTETEVSYTTVNSSAIGSVIAQPMAQPKQSESDSTNTPNGDAIASAPPKKFNVVWDLGVSVLTNGGMNERNARSLLGSLAKNHGKDALAQAIASTSSANPADPQSYLVKLLKNAAGKNGKPKPQDAISGAELNALLNRKAPDVRPNA